MAGSGVASFDKMGAIGIGDGMGFAIGSRGDGAATLHNVWGAFWRVSGAAIGVFSSIGGNARWRFVSCGALS